MLIWILNLNKDITLALKASAIRILSPIPEKGLIGFEIPNKIPSFVYLKDIIFILKIPLLIQSFISIFCFSFP